MFGAWKIGQAPSKSEVDLGHGTYMLVWGFYGKFLNINYEIYSGPI